MLMIKKVPEIKKVPIIKKSLMLGVVGLLAACSAEPMKDESISSLQSSSQTDSSDGSVSSSSLSLNSSSSSSSLWNSSSVASVASSSSSLSSSSPATSSSIASSSSIVSSSSQATSSSETINSSSLQSSSQGASQNSSQSSANNSSAAPTGIVPTAACPDRAVFGSRQVKLLTAQEYQNTLEDLVGIDFSVIEKLPTDDVIEDFYNNFATVPTESHIDAYLTLADDISVWAKARNFAGLASCDGQQASCNESFAREFGEKAYRRPLTNDEVQRILAATNDDRLLEGDNQEAIRLIMMAILGSPEFIFRFELGQLENDPGPTINKSYRKLETTYKDNAVNLTLDSSTKQFYVRDEWPENSALIEFTATAAQGDDGTWPLIKIRNATTTFDTVYEITGPQTRLHQIFIPEGITKGTRHFYIYFQNPESGATLALETVSISAALEEVEVIPYEPTPDDIFVLDDYEMASFLSYTFMGTMPDSALLAAAERGELSSEAEIETQIERLLQTPRGQKQLERFADQWLGVDIIADASTTAKDPNLFPEFTQDIRDALAQEVRETFKQNVLTSAPFSEFFASDYVYANNTLADFYGLSGANGDSFNKINAGSDRGGFLTTGAFMGAFAHPDHTAPIIRSVRLRESLMCQYLPDPPNNLDLERADSAAALNDDWRGGNITARHYFGELTSISACAGCHVTAINPLGFALEDYDPIGQPRTQDVNGHIIDAQGALFGEQTVFGGDETPLTGAKAVSAFLAQSTRTDYCFTEKAFRYMNATGPDTITRRNDVQLAALSTEEKSDYACAVDHVSQLLTQTQDVKEVFKKLSTSTLVRYRKERNR